MSKFRVGERVILKKNLGEANIGEHREIETWLCELIGRVLTVERPLRFSSGGTLYLLSHHGSRHTWINEKRIESLEKEQRG